jgi:hypothetical protein
VQNCTALTIEGPFQSGHLLFPVALQAFKVPLQGQGLPRAYLRFRIPYAVDSVAYVMVITHVSNTRHQPGAHGTNRLRRSLGKNKRVSLPQKKE